MTQIDGAGLRGPLDLDTDVVVIGSGPAGCAVARRLSARGIDVLVVEAGPRVAPTDFARSALGSMSAYYRSWGASVVVGRAPLPYVQGQLVGGSSPINGAICWRLPKDVYAEWCQRDSALSQALPWQEIEQATDDIERRLSVAPTPSSVAGLKNQLMAQGADALGLEHRPIRRNVVDCEGLGRCMQGCPKGAKQSVDRTLLQDALDSGNTRLLYSTEVESIEQEGGRATGVLARSISGQRVQIRASRAVVLAASAVQSPLLLLKSGIRAGPVGRHFTCHPGVSLAGRFKQQVRMWQGATQGHEVIGLRKEGLKFEALGFGLGVMAGRLSGVGRQLSDQISEMANWLDWGVAVRATAEGRVRWVAGRPVVTYTPSAQDIRQFRRGLRVLGELMFAAGAQKVSPGVRGFPETVSSVAELRKLEHSGPRSPAAYTAAITHMFGTCRMGADPKLSVVRPDFRHHTVDALYVADSSVFPSNIGVNPQVPIMALAQICANRISN